MAIANVFLKLSVDGSIVERAIAEAIEKIRRGIEIDEVTVDPQASSASRIEEALARASEACERQIAELRSLSDRLDSISSASRIE